jgi:hypothetical protein
VSGASAQEAPPPLRPYAPGLLPEPSLLSMGVDFADRFLGERPGADGKEGLGVAFGGMVGGAGWLALGPSYRVRLFDRAVLDVSAAVSWRRYSSAQAQFELPGLMNSRLTTGLQAVWQDFTQLNYFGTGDASVSANRSAYRLRATAVVGYAAYRPTRWLTARAEAGLLGGVDLLSPAGWFQRDLPDARTTFPDEPVYRMSDAPAYLHGELSLTADTRDYADHPSMGGVYRAALAVYDDRRSGAFSFQRYEAEAMQLAPLFEGRWVLAGRALAVLSDTTAGRTVPFYLMPHLGGSHLLRAYPNYRFADRHMVLTAIESRWALFTHVELAAFVEAGNVAAGLDELDLAKRSVGLGMRFHAQTSTIARIDAAHGTEGWRVLFSLNDPFRLKRAKRRTPQAPFSW